MAAIHSQIKSKIFLLLCWNLLAWGATGCGIELPSPPPNLFHKFNVLEVGRGPAHLILKISDYAKKYTLLWKRLRGLGPPDLSYNRLPPADAITPVPLTGFIYNFPAYMTLNLTTTRITTVR